MTGSRYIERVGCGPSEGTFLGGEGGGQSEEGCTYKGIYIKVSKLHLSKDRWENRQLKLNDV